MYSFVRNFALNVYICMYVYMYKDKHRCWLENWCPYRDSHACTHSMYENHTENQHVRKANWCPLFETFVHAVCTCVRVYVCKCACVTVCKYVCVSTCMFIYIHIYVHTYTEGVVAVWLPYSERHVTMYYNGFQVASLHSVQRGCGGSDYLTWH